jgi:hypothetical protein
MSTYFAIEASKYTKGVWLPEEVGSTLEELAAYVSDEANHTNGGFSIDAQGKLTPYTEQQLYTHHFDNLQRDAESDLASYYDRRDRMRAEDQPGRVTP